MGVYSIPRFSLGPAVVVASLGLGRGSHSWDSRLGGAAHRVRGGCLPGMISPSMTSAVYFGAFLGLGSWWACGQALSTVAFSTLCVFMAIFTASHLGGLYLYQLPFFQNCVPPDDIYARY